MKIKISLILLLTLSLPVFGMTEKDFLVVCDSVGGVLTLDPHKQFSGKNHIICQQIFEGLLRFNPDGKIEPALATSWKRIDDLRVRFNLRKGVKFHNGETFDAKAVKFSIERYFKPEINFPALGFIKPMTHAEIINNYTVDIITSRPDGLLLNRLAAFVLIIPPKYLKEMGDEHFAKNPVGTGAFKFGKWIKGEKVVLPSNENYWMKGYPKVKGLAFVYLHPEKRLKPLLEGKIHLVTNFPGTQTSFIRKNPKTDIIKKPTFRTLTFSFDVSSKYLSNLKVRKALNYAINKRDLIRYDLMGNGKRIATLSMPGEAGHNPNLKPYEYNVSRAKKLLTEAGYPKGFSISVATKKTAIRSAKIIASQLKKIGVKLDIVLLPMTTLMTSAKSGEYDMQLGDIPDPMCHNYFIQYLKFYHKSPFSMWKDPVFGRMIMDMASTIDEKLRDEKAKTLDTYIYENALSIFTYQKMSVIAKRKNVEFEPYVSGMPYFFSAYLKKE